MRLTLRTLLASIDGILSEQDQRELTAQIEASDNAKELLHRTRDTVQRIRLGAPALDSESHDANSVAEYLDNAMSPEDVVEFERRCLESDPELAEVASAHRILTMVLGQRAEIDADLKQVIYDLPASQRMASMAPAASPATASPSASPLPPSLPAPSLPAPSPPAPPTPPPIEPVATSAAATPILDEATVPDYLQTEHKPLLWRFAPAIATLLLLGGAVWLFAPGGWYDRVNDHPEVANNNATPAAELTGDPSTTAPGTAAPGTAPVAEDNTPKIAPQGAADVAPPIDSPPVTHTPPVPSHTPGEAPPAPAIADNAGDQSAAASQEEPITSIDKTPDSPTVARIEVPTTELPGLPADEAAPGIDVKSIDEVAPGIDAKSIDDLVAAASAAAAQTPEQPESVQDAPAIERVVVGSMSAPREVLIRYNEQLGDWQRPNHQAAEMPKVSMGDRLLSLPSYRPMIRLQGVDVTLSGATLVEVLPTTRPSAVARLRLVYGRLIATNKEGEQAEVELTVGDVTSVANIRRGSLLAVEAERPFQVGLDPTVESPALEALYYSPRGGLTWTGPEGEVNVDQRSAWRQNDAQIASIEADTVEINWLDSEPLTKTQRTAAEALALNLGPGEPIWPQLAEQYNSRRPENRAQVAISSMYVGHYDPSLRALGDLAQKNYWQREIDAIRATMSRSPELAEAVRSALVEIRGEQYAADLYRLLCGFSSEEIGTDREQRQAGILPQLIDWLQSDQTDYRVLANYNLEQITGRVGAFNPDGSPGSRASSLSRLRRYLRDDELLSRGSR